MDKSKENELNLNNSQNLFNALLFNLKHSYVDPGNQEYSSTKYNPDYGKSYYQKSDYENPRDDWKLDEEILKKIDDYKIRGTAKDIFFKICKVAGILPETVYDIFEKVFYKFFADDFASMKYYPLVKNFLNFFDKTVHKGANQKEFIVMKGAPWAGAKFFRNRRWDNRSVLGNNVFVITEKLINLVDQNEDFIAIISAKEIAKSFSEQDDISNGIAFILSIILNYSGRAILRAIYEKKGMMGEYGDAILTKKEKDDKAFKEKREKEDAEKEIKDEEKFQRRRELKKQDDEEKRQQWLKDNEEKNKSRQNKVVNDDVPIEEYDPYTESDQSANMVHDNESKKYDPNSSLKEIGANFKSPIPKKKVTRKSNPKGK